MGRTSGERCRVSGRQSKKTAARNRSENGAPQLLVGIVVYYVHALHMRSLRSDVPENTRLYQSAGGLGD